MELEIGEIKELCDHCLGRLFASLGHGLTNEERGKAIRVIYAMDHDLNISDLYPDKCELCNNIFDKIEHFADIVIKAIEGYEFNTFLIGTRNSREIVERDRIMLEKYGNRGEDIGNELSREIGKAVYKRIGKDVSFNDPDITIVVDTEYEYAEVLPKPIFIYGRYRKLERGIPQTRWIHGEGKSVEEYIGDVANSYFLGEKYYLHGAGREDVDVLMLGDGRPFVLEIKSPRKRNIDLSMLQEEINRSCSGKVEVLDLKYVKRDMVKKIKSMESRKVYMLRIELEREMNFEDLENRLKQLEGKVIYQRTPWRERHRRPDRVREKRIHSIRLVSLDGRHAEIEIISDAGTYIKELAHGDNGRTRPSISEMLDQKIKIERLDVVKILDRED
ncbi:MAG: tRNA pseudouridine(54/55) synthase Pus10 [Thermoplasmata archaeon]|jgi:tRNA pseudouridine synthase 10